MTRIGVAALSVALLALASSSTAEEPKLLEPILIPASTPDDDVDPHVASDGLTLYFSVKTKDRYEFRASRRSSTRRYWGKAAPIDDRVNSEGNDQGVFVTQHGRYPMFLFFSTNRTNEVKTNFDILGALKPLPGADKVFSFPRRIAAINSDADEKYPWVTANNRTIYFSRRTKDSWQLFVASRRDSGGIQGWDDPVAVPGIPVGFHHATLTADGRTMYLEGPVENGRLGLFVSKRGRESWSKPEPVSGLNHPKGERGTFAPCLSRDGRLLYFVSDRPEGKGGVDLYVIATRALR